MADTTTPLQIPLGVTGDSAAVAALNKVQAGVRNLQAGVSTIASRINTNFAAIASGFGKLAQVFAAGALVNAAHKFHDVEASTKVLEAALRRAGEANEDFIKGFVEAGKALTTMTGVSGSTVREMQRVLLTLGATGEQVQALSPLVLDLASAMGIEAYNAARVLGAALDGTGIKVGRMNIVAKDFNDLTRQLQASVGGAAEEAWKAQGGWGRMTLEFNRLTVAVGSLVEEPITAFLTGLVGGVSDATKALKEFKAAHEHAFEAVAAGVGRAGRLIGEHLDKLILLIAGYKAWQMAIGLVNGVANVLFGTTMAAALVTWGKSLVAIQGLTAQFGLLKTAALGAGTVISGLLAAAAVGAGAWFVGTWLKDVEILGDTIENRLTRQLLRLQVIWIEFKQRLFGGTPELQAEAEALRAEIDKTTLAQQRAAEAADAALQARQNAEAQGEPAAGPRRARPGVGGITATQADLIRGKGNVAVEEEILARGRAALERDFEEKRLTVDQFANYRAEQIEETYRLEVVKLRQAAQEAQDQQAAALELKEAERLAHEKFVSAIAELDADLAKKRASLREAELKAELEAQDKVLQARRREIQTTRDREQNSFRIGREEKRRLEISSLTKEQAVIDEDLRGLGQKRDAEKDPAARAQLDASIRGLESERRGVSADLAKVREGPDPESVTDQFEASIIRAEDRLNTFAEGVGNVFGSVIQGAVDGIAGSIEGLIKGTMDWGDALRNIAGSIMNSVISAFARMFAEWMVKRMMMMVFNKTASIEEGATDASAKAPGALMSSISSYGVAAIVGLAAMVAALAAIGGGFRTGGYTGNTSPDQPAGVVHGREFVLNAPAVAKFGLPLLNAMNRGAVTGQAVPMNPGAVANYALPLVDGINGKAASAGSLAPAGGLPAPWEGGRAGQGVQAAAATARGLQATPPPGSVEGERRRTVNVVMVDNRNAARDYLRTAEGEAHILDVVRRRSFEVGIPS